MTSYPENRYLNQYRDLKLFYKEYVGDYIFSLIITCDKMETFFPKQIIDLKFQ